MIAAPSQRSSSPFLCSPSSPLSLSLLLEERKAASQNQTVPISPSLSPLTRQTRHNNNVRSSTPIPGASRALGRSSPIPALVPEAGERVFSGSPLLRQILTAGHKRQRDGSPNTPTTPSPIAVTSKRFCRHCPTAEVGGDSSSSSLVIISRNKRESKTRKTAPSSDAQVVPDYSPASDGSSDDKRAVHCHQGDLTLGSKDILELFAGPDDDIFAH